MPTTRTPLLAAVAVVFLALPAASCGSAAKPIPEHAPVSASSATWTEPDRYSFTLHSTAQVGAGRYRITVNNGQVVEAVGLDDPARRTLARGTRNAPTLGELLDRLERARARPADVAEVHFAPDGHPTEIHLDWDKMSIDDEADYLITDYRLRD